jgi:hypothetical protein
MQHKESLMECEHLTIIGWQIHPRVLALQEVEIAFHVFIKISRGAVGDELK